MADADPVKRLTRNECLAKAKECRELARFSRVQEHRIMLEHMAQTWERIAGSLPTNGR